MKESKMPKKWAQIFNITRTYKIFYELCETKDLTLPQLQKALKDIRKQDRIRVMKKINKYTDFTPLHSLCHYHPEKWELISFLLNNGANLYIRNKNKYTPFYELVDSLLNIQFISKEGKQYTKQILEYIAKDNQLNEIRNNGIIFTLEKRLEYIKPINMYSISSYYIINVLIDSTAKDVKAFRNNIVYSPFQLVIGYLSGCISAIYKIEQSYHATVKSWASITKGKGVSADNIDEYMQDKFLPYFAKSYKKAALVLLCCFKSIEKSIQCKIPKVLLRSSILTQINFVGLEFAPTKNQNLILSVNSMTMEACTYYFDRFLQEDKSPTDKKI